MRTSALRSVPSTSRLPAGIPSALVTLAAAAALGLGLGACASLGAYKGPGPGSPWARCTSEADRGSYPGQDRPLIFFYCYESP